MAGTAIPRYLVGRNVAVFYGGALKINADGSVTPATDYTDFHAAGVFDTFEITFNFGLEEISATDAMIENHVSTKVSFDCNVGEIMQASGQSKLAQIGFSESNYIGVEMITEDPITGAAMVCSVVGIFNTIKTGVVQGRNVIMANILPCGIYPYYQPAQDTAGGSGATTASANGLSTGNIRVGHAVTGKTS